VLFLFQLFVKQGLIIFLMKLANKEAAVFQRRCDNAYILSIGGQHCLMTLKSCSYYIVPSRHV
jgi:hypothetical protein